MSGLHFGVRFWTPKRVPFCRQNFSHRRKIARVSIVSARTRQKFSMPLLFHGFAAPQALVLHTLRTFMATHVLELGRPSVAGPVFARVFGPQTGVQKNHFFRSLEGAKSLENL